MAEKQPPKGTVTFRTPVQVSDAGLVYIEIRTHLDASRIWVWGVPTLVTRGVYRGFSLPVYADDYEELFFQLCVPNRYDEASDIKAHVICYLDTANTDKKFNLQLSWQHLTPGTGIVPATTHDVDVETDVAGAVSQYQSFPVEFTIDYDIDTPDNVVFDDLLGIRLRRIGASEAEIAGELVIAHLGVIFRRNKLGVAA